MLKLRPYQEEALAALPERGRPLIALPTGTGKTLCFAELLRRRAGKSIVLAHRDELISQAVEKIGKVWPEAQIGIVKAERNEIEAPVVVASVQTLRGKRLEGLPQFDTCIVDEAHHSMAEGWRAAIEQIAAPLTVGFTATPERSDSKDLRELWDGIVYRKTLFEMIAAGYLCDLRAKQIRLKGLDLHEVKERGGDYQDGDLGRALENANAPVHVASAYNAFAKGRKALAFLPTVNLAAQTVEEMWKLGTRAALVSGETPIEERREILKMFPEGKFDVISNCAVLLEGYDEPSVSCILMARPTKSRVLYQQAVGRGTRTFPGKEDCVVLDFVGATTEHDLITMAELFGIREETAEAGIVALLESVKGGAAGEVEKAAAAELSHSEVKLTARMHWVSDGNRYYLSCGEETLTLQKLPEETGGEAWAIRSIPRDRNAKTRLMFRGLDLPYAQGVAEDYARDMGASVLVTPSAKWRRNPASQKQVELLQKMRAWRPGLSSGEAADILTVRFMRGR